MHQSHSLTVRAILASSIVAATYMIAACNKPTTPIPEPMPPTATQPAAFTSDDRRVIEAAVLSLITDPDYQPNRAQGGNYDSIGLLDTTRPTPCRLSLEILRNCPAGTGLTPEAHMADCMRNETMQVLDHAGWDPRIILVETGKYPPSSLAHLGDSTFENTHATSNGLIAARLPIYLVDGNHAYLKVSFNWSRHWAEVEMWLQKTNGVWRVQRRVFRYFV